MYFSLGFHLQVLPKKSLGWRGMLIFLAVIFVSKHLFKNSPWKFNIPPWNMMVGRQSCPFMALCNFHRKNSQLKNFGRVFSHPPIPVGVQKHVILKPVKIHLEQVGHLEVFPLPNMRKSVSLGWRAPSLGDFTINPTPFQTRTSRSTSWLFFWGGGGLWFLVVFPSNKLISTHNSSPQTSQTKRHQENIFHEIFKFHIYCLSHEKNTWGFDINTLPELFFPRRGIIAPKYAGPKGK